MRDNPAFDSIGYWPNTPSQWREPTVDDCTWYATEFAFQAADQFHRNFHPVLEIRNLSTDRVGGTPVDVAVRDTAKLWPGDGDIAWKYGSWTKDEIRRALNTGATVVVGGDYLQLPLHYRRWTWNDDFAHAMAHRFLLEDNRTALYDPLGGGPQRVPYDGEWIGLGQLYGTIDDFVWKRNESQYWAAIIDSKRTKKTVKRLYYDPADAKKEARVSRGTPVYSRPTTASDVVKKWWHEEKYYKLIGRVDIAWYAVWYWDGSLRESLVGYVAKQDILHIQDRQVITHPDSTEDEDALIIETLMAEKAELEQQLDDAAAALPPLVDALTE